MPSSNNPAENISPVLHVNNADLSNAIEHPTIGAKSLEEAIEEVAVSNEDSSTVVTTLVPQDSISETSQGRQDDTQSLRESSGAETASIADGAGNELTPVSGASPPDIPDNSIPRSPLPVELSLPRPGVDVAERPSAPQHSADANPDESPTSPLVFPTEPDIAPPSPPERINHGDKTTIETLTQSYNEMLRERNKISFQHWQKRHEHQVESRNTDLLIFRLPNSEQLLAFPNWSIIESYAMNDVRLAEQVVEEHFLQFSHDMMSHVVPCRGRRNNSGEFRVIDKGEIR